MKALVVAYKIENGKGSEDGSGYEIVRALVRAGAELTLISRVNNIDKLRDDPAFSSVQLIGVDVPRALSFYKRGGRGVILYYYLWQVLVGRRVTRLQRSEQFDVLHQLNFHADWAAHFLRPSAQTGLVWGPIAHHRWVPVDCLPRRRRLAFWAREVALATVKQAFWRLDPNLRRAIRRTDVILYANDDPAPPFRAARTKTVVRTYGASSVPVLPPNRAEAFTVLTVGRLVPLKGPALVVEAFSRFLGRRPDAAASLTIVGAGPMLDELEHQCAQLGIDERVRFVAWLPQAELARHYAEASLFLYPSFEAQGLVVGEAMAAGVPIACLQGTGPATLAGPLGSVVERRSRREMVEDLSAIIEARWDRFQATGRDGDGASSPEAVRYAEHLGWDPIAADILAAYRSAAGARTAGAGRGQ